MKRCANDLASFPGLCAFVTCSTKLRRPGPFHHVIRAAAYVTTIGTNDVIDELAACLVLKEAPRDRSNGSCANLPKC